MPGTLPLRRYDLVVSDIDGCLSAETSTPFDLANLARIREHNDLAVSRGDRPLVTVCSGRPQPFAEAMCRLIGNALVPCVCENGAWVYHPGSNQYTLDPAITPSHFDAVRELSKWARIAFGPRGVTEQPGKTASVTLYHPDTLYLTSEVLPAVRERCDSERWPFRVSMTWLYINCDLAHISKGSGLDRLLAEARIPRERLAGIGDTPGDKCIADRVAHFACPANAHAAIREHAHYVSPLPEAAGVVDILSRLTA